MRSFMFLICLHLSSCLSSEIEARQKTEDEYHRERLAMVETQLKSRDIWNSRVLEAMSKVPRHLLIPTDVRRHAYVDSPVPIGNNQTISQPYIVALMTQTVDPQPTETALEIGTGSGYQAAVLAELVDRVFSVEIIPKLAETARKNLGELGYENVTVLQGDGYRGWPEKGPFGVIVVTAAAEKIPPPLIEQLAEGGRLVMPVGKVRGIQSLILLTKRDGKISERFLTSVRFVPMTGEVQR